MVVGQENVKQIEAIMRGMKCHGDFECYKSGFENLSNVGIVGDAKMIECIEEKAQTCEFGHSFGHGYICKCPLRNYIAKNFYR